VKGKRKNHIVSQKNRRKRGSTTTEKGNRIRIKVAGLIGVKGENSANKYKGRNPAYKKKRTAAEARRTIPYQPWDMAQ